MFTTMAPPANEATLLLQRIQGGDPAAKDELLGLLYNELRGLAGSLLARERKDHTLQPTELVHEVWLRTLGDKSAHAFDGSAHFLASIAKAMRHVLVDHARARASLKRGEGQANLGLDAVLDSFHGQSLDVVELSDALEWLQGRDPELARLVELRYFAGLSIPETATVLGVSASTVERSWRIGRMWLRRALPG